MANTQQAQTTENKELLEKQIAETVKPNVQIDPKQSKYHNFLAKKVNESKKLVSPRIETLFRQKFESLSSTEKTLDIDARLNLAWNYIWGIPNNTKGKGN